jgi:hypothetical protein
MLRRAFVLLQLEAACTGFNLLVWIVPTPINKYRHLFVHISFFLYLFISLMASLPAPYHMCGATLVVDYVRCCC